MANIGDAAAAAGMAVLTGGEDAATLDEEVNRTRDYIAQRTSTVQPVNKGGTGATSAAAARANLGAAAAADVATSLAGKAATGHKHTTGDITSGVLPIARGGTGASSIDGARASLDVAPNIAYYGGFRRDVWDRNITGQRRSAWIEDAGGTINLGHTASTRASKQNIRPVGLTEQQLRAIPVVLYRYRAEVDRERSEPGYRAATEIGTIADDLHDLGLWHFVVYEGRGDDARPVSVHYELLGLAALALAQQLAGRLDALEKRLSGLEARDA